MAMRRKRPKRASKVQERKLINNARKLAKDPLKVIPKCEGRCFLCKFSRAEKYIKKIVKHKEDKEYLKKYSNKGPDLAKAVAGTLLLALTHKAPLLASTRTPDGKISYAKRGNANEERLIGVQHFNDPHLRLLAYSFEAKKGFYFYSWDDNIVCTGKKDNPPNGYVKNTLDSLPYNMRKRGDKIICPHITNGDRSYIQIDWSAAGLTLKLCSRCADNNKNLVHHLSRGMISKDNSKSFEISTRYNMMCRTDCSECKLDRNISMDKDLVKAYERGETSDRELLRKYKRDAMKTLVDRSRVYIVGDYCYGSDMGALLRQFDYESWEEEVIKKAIESANSIVLEQGTVNELLEKVWDEGALDLIKTITNDDGMAEQIYQKYHESSVNPRDVLRKAMSKRKEKDRLSSLPEFKDLPPKAKLANDLARLYKIKGEDSVLRQIDNSNLSDTRMKSLAFGFLAALDKGDTKKWKFNSHEIESGEYLSSYVKKLLNSEGMEYANALQELIKMSGSTSMLTLKNGKKLR
ncbi:MAG: hypothetical protein R6U61_06850 [Thermoplasmata archaeon]